MVDISQGPRDTASSFARGAKGVGVRAEDPLDSWDDSGLPGILAPIGGAVKSSGPLSWHGLFMG